MDAPINSRPVCRFYLPSLAAHFYTGLANECARFKDDLIASSGWNKEGAVFCVPGLPETEKTVVVAGRQGIYSDATSSVATGTGPVLGPRSGTGDFSQWNDPAHMAGFAGG